MRDFYGILGAGAFGGALSWLFSITIGSPLPLNQGAAAFASILLVMKMSRTSETTSPSPASLARRSA